MLVAEHAPRLPSLVARPIEGDCLRQSVRLLVIAGRQYSPALDAFIKVLRLRDWSSHRKDRAPHQMRTASAAQAINAGNLDRALYADSTIDNRQ
jgi:hypothetical protein